jgi:hypothetical protein
MALVISVTGKSQAFQNGTFVGNLGVGFGWYSYGYSTTSLPALSLSVEQGVYKIKDIGVISAGGIIGFKHASYDYNWFGATDKWSWNDLIVAARSAFHMDLFHNNKIDPYAGVALGVRIESSHTTSDVLGVHQNTDHTSTLPLIAGYAGCRYYFTDKLAGFGELGYGLGYITLGLSYKMK